MARTGEIVSVQRIVIAIVATCFAASIHGQNLSLPLDGYFRPGAYMPVIRRAGPSLIRADVVTTQSISDGVVPVFVFSALTDHVECGDTKLSLHVLADDQRLVGCATHDDAVIAMLFPKLHIVTIDLDPGDTLPGWPIAWDSLDAVIVDSIDSSKAMELVGMGMTVIVRSDSRPDTMFPWKRVLDAWVLRPVSAPPTMLGERV